MLVSRRSAGVHFELGRLAGILACVTLGGTAALLTDSSEDAGRIDYGQALLIKTGALVVLALVLWLTILEASERRRFDRWMRERSRGPSAGSAA
jgi:hypothetical protein